MIHFNFLVEIPHFAQNDLSSRARRLVFRQKQKSALDRVGHANMEPIALYLLLCQRVAFTRLDRIVRKGTFPTGFYFSEGCLIEGCLTFVFLSFLRSFPPPFPCYLGPHEVDAQFKRSSRGLLVS